MFYQENYELVDKPELNVKSFIKAFWEKRMINENQKTGVFFPSITGKVRVIKNQQNDFTHGLIEKKRLLVNEEVFAV